MTATRIDALAIVEGVAPDGNPIVHQHESLLIESGIVAAIAPTATIAQSHPSAAVLGGPRTVVMPGLINAHHHIGLTPLRLGAPDLPLELWIARLLGLRDVDIYLDTLFSAFEMIRSGVTTVNHLPIHTAGDVDQVAGAAGEVIRAYSDIGMRAVYSMTFRDQNRIAYESDSAFTERAPDALKPLLREHFGQFKLSVEGQVEAFDSIRSLKRVGDRIRVQLAPANLHWLSDHALEVVADLSAVRDLPMHMHLVETPYQAEYARKRTGGSAFAYIHKMGLTGPRLTIGHGVWMSEEDIDLCAQTGTHVCHNCSSNMRLRSGLAPVNQLVAAGVPVCLGLDEAGINDDRDMLQEMRLVLRAHARPGVHAINLTPSQVFQMATANGAATTSFGGAIGSLQVGSLADCVLLDWDNVTQPWQSPDIPILDVLVQRARAQSIAAVMIAGEVVFADGNFLKVDEAAILDEISSAMRRELTESERGRQAMSRQLFPMLQRFYADYGVN